jgi:anaerobic ribonucleoside-triphosphate reductase
MAVGTCKCCGKDLIDTCPICGEPVTTYSRPCGYLTSTARWNDGKQQEFRDRTEYVNWAGDNIDVTKK